jgi:bacteriocin-like protein
MFMKNSENRILARALAEELTEEELKLVSGGVALSIPKPTAPPQCKDTAVTTSVNGGPPTEDDPDYICVL